MSKNKMNVLSRFDQPDSCAKQVESPSLLDNLKRSQRDAQSRLDDLNAAIEALEKNPEVAKVLELVARAR